MSEDQESLKPVILITGLPGEGKTLYAVSNYLKGKANAYAGGLKGSVFPSVDPSKWFETPEGSLVVVDEAWKWFAPVSPTKEPPDHYAKVPEIRHSGHVLVLVTQHPNDLDARIRRRVGKHYHVVRIFGSERANIHEWNHCHADVESRVDTESFVWEYDKTSYPLYKSATDHKIKIEIPRRLKRVPLYLGGAVLMVAGGLWWAYDSISGAGGKTDSSSSGSGPIDAMKAFAKPAQKQAAKEEKRPMSAVEYVLHQTPRIQTLEYTAPVYDELTKPVRVPVPVACVQSKSQGCKCWSQQATPMQVDASFCQQVVKGGMFLAFNPDGESREKVSESMPVSRDASPLPSGIVESRTVSDAAAPGLAF